MRAPKALVTGLALIALAAVALIGTMDLQQGTLRAMGPAMMPRYVAILLGLAGIGLAVSAFLRDGEPLDPVSLRGPILIGASVVLFGLTIRSLGLAVAGPISLLLASWATPEVRPRSAMVLAVAMTAFCILLFRGLLDLPLPILEVPGTGIRY